MGPFPRLKMAIFYFENKANFEPFWNVLATSPSLRFLDLPNMSQVFAHFHQTHEKDKQEAFLRCMNSLYYLYINDADWFELLNNSITFRALKYLNFLNCNKTAIEGVVALSFSPLLPHLCRIKMPRFFGALVENREILEESSKVFSWITTEDNYFEINVSLLRKIPQEYALFKAICKRKATAPIEGNNFLAPSNSPAGRKIFKGIDPASYYFGLNVGLEFILKPVDLEKQPLSLTFSKGHWRVEQALPAQRLSGRIRGSVGVMTNGQWQALATLSPIDRIESLSTEPSLPDWVLELSYNEDWGLFFIRLSSALREPVVLVSYTVLYSPERRLCPAQRQGLLTQPSFANLMAKCQPDCYESYLSTLPLTLLAELVLDLAKAIYSFAPQALQVSALDEANLMRVGLEGKGSCQQRVIFLLYLTRLIRKQHPELSLVAFVNDVHAYLGLKRPSEPPLLIDLGGSFSVDLNYDERLFQRPQQLLPPLAPDNPYAYWQFKSSRFSKESLGKDFVAELHQDPRQIRNFLFRCSNEEYFSRLYQVLLGVSGIRVHYEPLEKLSLQDFAVDESGRLLLRESAFKQFLAPGAESTSILLLGLNKLNSQYLSCLNALLDRGHRRFQELAIPPAHFIVVLATPLFLQKAGADFYTRIPGPYSDLEAFKLPPDPLLQSDAPRIKFYDEDWEKRLVGKVRLGFEGFYFKAGRLLKALTPRPRQIILVNPPNDLGFESWLAQVGHGGEVEINRQVYSLPELVLVRETNEIALQASDFLVLQGIEAGTYFPASFIINQVTVKSLFGPHSLIKKARGGSLHLTLTASLSHLEWVHLLDKSQKWQVKLFLFLSEGLSFPLHKDLILEKVQGERALPHHFIHYHSPEVLEEVTLWLTKKYGVEPVVVHLTAFQNLYALVEVLEPDNPFLLRENQVALKLTRKERFLLNCIKNEQPVLLVGDRLNASIETIVAAKPYLHLPSGEVLACPHLYCLVKESPLALLKPRSWEAIKAEESFSPLWPIAPWLDKIADYLHQRGIYLLQNHYRRLQLWYEQAIPYSPFEWLSEQYPALDLTALNDLWPKPLQASLSTENRLDLVNKLFGSGLPLLFITGPAGCGKTHFASEILPQSHAVWFGLAALKRWAKAAETPEGRFNVLVLDEANIKGADALNAFLSVLKGELIYGAFRCQLTPSHKVLFLGNFATVKGRELLDVSLHSGCFLRFPALTWADQYNQFLRSFHWIMQALNKSFSLPEEIRQWFEVWIAQHPQFTLRDIQNLVVFGVLDALRRPEGLLESLKKTGPLLERQSFNTCDKDYEPYQTPQVEGFCMQKNWKLPLLLIERLLTLGELRKRHPQQANQSGVRGVILEGEPALGKTTLLRRFLLQKGYQEVTLKDRVSGAGKYFIVLNPSKISQAFQIMERAFHSGWIVLADELNTLTEIWESEEFLLYLSGLDAQGKPPAQEGFAFISTQNDETCLNRETLSQPMQNRCLFMPINPYTLEAAKEIGQSLGYSKAEIKKEVKKFKEASFFAKKTHRQPPMPGALLLRLLGQKPNTFFTAQPNADPNLPPAKRSCSLSL